MIVMLTMMKMVTCVMVDSDDEHLGHTPSHPYSLPDLSRFGNRSTPSPPTYNTTLINNNRTQNHKKTQNMNDKVLNAYSDNAKHISGSSLEMEDLPQNPKHNVYENPKPKANQIHPFFETIHWFHSKKIPFKKKKICS